MDRLLPPEQIRTGWPDAAPPALALPVGTHRNDSSSLAFTRLIGQGALRVFRAVCVARKYGSGQAVAVPLGAKPQGGRLHGSNLLWL